MRRAFVYPHRAVRSAPITPARWVLALICAVVLTAAMVTWTTPVISEHNRLCVALLEGAGISVTSIRAVELFSAFEMAPVPVVDVLSLERSNFRHWLFFSGAMLALLAIHRRYSLARSFVTFLMALLILTSGMVIFHPASKFGSAEFAQMWLRGELLVWLVLPWFSAGMFILTQPATLFGIVSALFAQAYGFVWSAVRLSFCIALMHFSGILFAPMFWFALGFLSDVIYLVVIYSLVINRAAARERGRRL